MSSNPVCNHTRDKQIGRPRSGRPILLSLVWLQTQLDFTQSYYHALLSKYRYYTKFFNDNLNNMKNKNMAGNKCTLT